MNLRPKLYSISLCRPVGIIDCQNIVSDSPQLSMGSVPFFEAIDKKHHQIGEKRFDH